MSDSATSWTVACQATLSMGFSRQEYWSGLPFPSLGNLPDPGIEHASSALAGGLSFFSGEGEKIQIRMLQFSHCSVTRQFQLYEEDISDKIAFALLSVDINSVNKFIV